MTDSTPLERILKRDRAIVLAALVAITVLCWVYMVVMAAGMSDMPMDGEGMGGMPAMQHWTPGYFAMMLLMWVLMMIGMMVPSAAPMILLFASVSRRQRESGNAFVPTGVFVLGYLIVWSGFSLAATLIQWALDEASMLSPMMASTSPYLGGGILIVAGIYQMTPLKHACLNHCRSPLHFVKDSWRPGAKGALVMGLEHGAFCVGCCWILMGLLFFGGVMSLVWIAAIAVFVLFEKVMPRGDLVGILSGAALAIFGLGYLLLR